MTPGCRYLERREMVMTALRLAWLLHFAAAPAATSAGFDLAAATPSSLRQLIAMARLTCTDMLLALSLLFPVRLCFCYSI